VELRRRSGASHECAALGDTRVCSSARGAIVAIFTSDRVRRWRPCGTVAREILIIVMTGYADVPTSVRALKGGTIDFLRKPVPPKQVIARIREAIDVDRRARDVASQRAAVADRIAQLTQRELELMKLLAVGRSTRQHRGHTDLPAVCS
jgi:PleD family two-component response regulator